MGARPRGVNQVALLTLSLSASSFICQPRNCLNSPALRRCPAGNMTVVPQPGVFGQSYNAASDAWNRLISLSSGTDPVAVYQYDGLNRRIVKQIYSSGSLIESRHLYYTAGWQVLEERVGASSNAQRQFAWGLRYID